MSRGSLLISSLKLWPSRLSTSEGDGGQGNSSVLVFLGALLSSPSLSEISSVRPCLLPLGVQDSSTRPFFVACRDFSALPSLLEVLTPLGEARPRDLSSSRGPGVSFFRPLRIDIESLFCRVFILLGVGPPFSLARLDENINFSLSAAPFCCSEGDGGGQEQVFWKGGLIPARQQDPGGHGGSGGEVE